LIADVETVGTVYVVVGAEINEESGQGISVNRHSVALMSSTLLTLFLPPHLLLLLGSGTGRWADIRPLCRQP
jgi:hypothetical protein